MSNGNCVKGEKVSLCPFEGPFWDVGLRWYNDHEIAALTSDDPSPLTEAQFREMIESDLNNPQSEVFGLLDADGNPIGVGMLRNIDPIHRGCDLHITIGEKTCWNRGFGREAISLMTEYAFKSAGMHRVISAPFRSNTRMVRCLEKVGFEKEGVLRDALWVVDRFIDVAVMAMINPEEKVEV